MIAGGLAPDLYIIPDPALPYYLVKKLARDLIPFVNCSNTIDAVDSSSLS